MNTVAIPQTLHLSPTQLTAVPVKVKLAVSPPIFELAAVPPLKAATSGPRSVQPVPVKVAALSSKRVVEVVVTVKLLALVAVPPGVVTLIGPLVAPLGTVAVIEVAELTLKVALTALKVTAVAPLKLVPLIVTTVPTAPLVGVKLVIVGALAVTVKLLLLVAVPPGVVTPIGPLVAPLGTVAVIEVAELTLKAALTPLKATALAPVKLVPLMLTLVPTGPLAGVKLLIVGALAVTVKLLLLVAVPPGVVTLIGPLVAPLGTVAVIEVAGLTVKAALTPLKATALAPVKLVPLMLTLVPTGPLPGVKPLIVGGLTLETVTVTGPEFQRTPKISCATAVKVCEPLPTVRVSQETEYGALVARPMKLLSTKKSTNETE